MFKYLLFLFFFICSPAFADGQGLPTVDDFNKKFRGAVSLHTQDLNKIKNLKQKETITIAAGTIYPTVDDFNKKIKEPEVSSTEGDTKIKNLEEDKKDNLVTAKDGQEELTLIIDKFIIKGNNSVSETEIQDVIKKYLNKPSKLEELDKAAEDVTNLYVEKGFWARAFLPEQDINNRELIIEIIEAKLGKVIIKKQDGKKIRLPDRISLKFLNRNQVTDEIFNIDTLNKNIQVLDSLSGVSASVSLEAGEVDGETDVILEMDDQKLITGNVKFDNHGSRSSGYGRATSIININSLLHRGETITLQNVHTTGSDYYSFGMTMPVGYNGTTATIRGSEMDYDLGVPLKSTNPQGNSDELSFSINFPTLNYKNLSTSISVGAGYNTYLNKTVSGVSSNKTNLKSNLDFNFSLPDNFLGGGLTSANLSFNAGEIDLGDDRSDLSSDQSAAKTHGKYEKIGLNFSRLQSLSEKQSLYFSANGQYGLKNLDSGEQISLGGISGIKSFPNSEAAGTHGIISTLEHRYNFNQRIQSKIFYDYGKIYQYKNTYSGWNSSNTALENSYEISGIGLSLDIILDNFQSISLIYSRKLSANPASDSSGKDTDGTNFKDRFWISISQNF